MGIIWCYKYHKSENTTLDIVSLSPTSLNIMFSTEVDLEITDYSQL